MSNAQWAIGVITTAQVIRSGMLFSFLRNESSSERKPNKFYTNSPLNKMSCRHCSFEKTIVGKMSVGKISGCGREQQWRHSTASRVVLFLYTLWRHLWCITVHARKKYELFDAVVYSIMNSMENLRFDKEDYFHVLVFYALFYKINKKHFFPYN